MTTLITAPRVGVSGTIVCAPLLAALGPRLASSTLAAFRIELRGDLAKHLQLGWLVPPLRARGLWAGVPSEMLCTRCPQPVAGTCPFVRRRRCGACAAPDGLPLSCYLGRRPIHLLSFFAPGASELQLAWHGPLLIQNCGINWWLQPFRLDW